ncbi:hypothetical protein [Sphingomonas qomolangmaensis]|uniref:RcnB family protein n=1 Tax=Sphingomonas qomolangmaensis TaxID=2918765 RepID=A0ABY5LCM2_9SPHN|nr:hypothetical protein [Sphingomonas qomolangmaensis]UUL83768.1 hypothetical protein NMP03_06120 [Sphingomonas qomolangmaensis]
MNINNMLRGLAIAALLISVPALAGNQGKGHGKGNSASQKQKGQIRHFDKRDRTEFRRVPKRDSATASCPRGLAKKNNGCVAPGLAKKQYAQGDRLPAALRTNNVPAAYADRYRDTATSLYRYNDGSIYRINPDTRRIAEVIGAPIR